MQTRAGRYLRQPTGYRAFSPKPLPPEPALDLTGDLQVLLEQAHLAPGRLDGAVQILPNPDLFVFMYVRREAVLSSQIEATQSSLQNLLAAEARLYDPDVPCRLTPSSAQALSALERFLHSDSHLPMLVTITLAHAQCEEKVTKRTRSLSLARLQAPSD